MFLYVQEYHIYLHFIHTQEYKLKILYENSEYLTLERLISVEKFIFNEKNYLLIVFKYSVSLEVLRSELVIV